MSEESQKSLRESLLEGLGEAPWSMLEAHAKRDGLIFVSAELELLDVAVALAQDDGDSVSNWMSRGLLTKPDEASLKTCADDDEHQWPFAIVAPFVLVRAKSEG